MKRSRPSFRVSLCHFLCCISLLSGCAGSKVSYDPLKKYSPGELQQDFDLLREVLEKFHPSLYAFTPKQAMDLSFQEHRAHLKDSMTEQQFGFHVLAPTISTIRCGHTTMSLSKHYTSFFRGVRMPSFPLYMKVWKDTMIVTRNLDAHDSILKKGTQITSINGLSSEKLADVMFRFLPADGFSNSLNYIRLSTAFPYYHRNIFGLMNEYEVGYIDSTGRNDLRKVPCYDPDADSLLLEKGNKSLRTETRAVRRPSVRQDRPRIELEKSSASAFMVIPSFEGKKTKKSFYKRSFETIRKEGIENLVIDLRNNGGGNVDNEARLARYLKVKSFRVTDTAAATIRKFGTFGRYFRNNVGNWLVLQFLCSRKSDGAYHLRYWENHLFHPIERNFFKGRVYIIIGGPTFSAASLFCNQLKGQQNITLVGEETGGGQYSNNGLLIPTVTLPNTRIRVRIPLFRMVPDRNAPATGRGVMPDIHVGPTAESVRNGSDLKLERVKSLIRESISNRGS